MPPHHRLLAWQRAHALAERVLAETPRIRARTYPGLASRLCAAASVVAERIADGAASLDDRQFAAHLAGAEAGGRTLEAALLLARDVGALPAPVAQSLLQDVAAVRRLVAGLRRRIERDAGAVPTGGALPAALRGLPLLTDATGLPLAATAPAPDAPGGTR